MFILRPDSCVSVSDSVVTCLEIPIDQLKGGDRDLLNAIKSLGVKPNEFVPPVQANKLGVLLNNAPQLFTELKHSPYQIFADFVDGR